MQNPHITRANSRSKAIDAERRLPLLGVYGAFVLIAAIIIGTLPYRPF